SSDLVLAAGNFSINRIHSINCSKNFGGTRNDAATASPCSLCDVSRRPIHLMRESSMPVQSVPAQPVDATQVVNLSAGVSIARSHVVIRLADEPLCSDGLANAKTGRCSLESTV